MKTFVDMKPGGLKRKYIVMVLSLLILLSVIIFAFEARGPILSAGYIHKIIESAQQKYNIPAISISILNAKQIQYSICSGVRVYGTDDKISKMDYFHIGSCSKAVLVYVTAKLVEKNLIGWDTKFFDIYPELKADAQKAYFDITLKDLLACRAGIQPYTSGIEEYPDFSLSLDKELDFIRYLLLQSPAARQNSSGKFEFIYSNASYTLADAMLEKASGLSYEELLQEYIVSELGCQVFVGWPYEKDVNQPWGHIESIDGSPTPIGPDSVYTINPLIVPAGHLSMTNEDFSKFVQLHLQGIMGISPLIDSQTIKDMDTEYSEFSLGTWNGTRGGKHYVCLDGSAGTYYARGVVIPDSDFGFSIMMNCGSEDAVEYITNEIMKAHFNWWWMLLI